MPSGDGGDERKRKKEDKKESKKHHKHSSSSSSKKRKREEESGDEEAAKQRRLVDKARAYLKEQEKKKKKKKKKKEEKDKDKDKKRHKDKKKDKKKERKEKEEDDGPPRRPIPERLSAEDDYYRRQTEFRVWLRMIKKANFESLTREEAQKQFEKFVDKWNKAQLDDMYYDGIPAHLQTQCHQTAHKWGFTNKLSEEDKFQLERTADRITALTAQRPPGSGPGPAAAASSSSMARAGGGMTAAEAQYAREVQQERERDERRAVGKVVRDKKREMLEDAIGGKATGREAMLAARQAKADRLHGAARAREEARDGLDVSESTLLGGDERDEIRRRVERQQERGQQRAEERERRIEELKRQEEEKMKTLLDTLGLKPGQKIVIPKRTDG